MDIEKTTTWMQMLADNWEIITGAMLVVIAGIDKVALVCIKTLRNIIDAWKENFGLDGVLRLHEAVGCDECGNTGYDGRL